MKFLDYITAKAQSFYWNETLSAKSEKPYLGEELYPNRKQPGIKLEWVKGANQQAVALHLSAFDAKVLKRNRIGFNTMSANMPFFKDSLDIDEELRQKLLVASSSNVAYIQELIRRIFDDNNTLIKSAAVTREMLRMQLLTTGTIAIANNGQEYLYDYGLADYQKPTVTTAWSNPDADVVGDITAYQDLMIEKTGVNANAEGKKILKAGTPVGGATNVLMNRQTVLTKVSDATAQGVLLHDVDVTAGQENATLVIEGVIDYEKVEEDVQAMYTSTVTGAMPKITIMKGSKV